MYMEVSILEDWGPINTDKYQYIAEYGMSHWHPLPGQLSRCPIFIKKTGIRLKIGHPFILSTGARYSNGLGGLDYMRRL